MTSSIRLKKCRFTKQSCMNDTEGEITYTLLQAGGYIKDNRLLPKGFDTTPVDERIAVKGYASKDNNFTGSSDSLTYRVNTKGFRLPFTIITELLYQTVSFNFLADLLSDQTSNGLLREFSSYNMPIVISKAQRKYE